MATDKRAWKIEAGGDGRGRQSECPLVLDGLEINISEIGTLRNPEYRENSREPNI
jgi:hypothetical protein